VRVALAGRHDVEARTAQSARGRLRPCPQWCDRSPPVAGEWDGATAGGPFGPDDGAAWTGGDRRRNACLAATVHGLPEWAKESWPRKPPSSRFR